MKTSTRLLVLALMLTIAQSGLGQIFPWTAFFGGPGADFATDIYPTSDNGYIVAGYGGDGNSANYYVIKLDQFGLVQWERKLNKDNYAEKAFSVLETSEGDFVVIGSATQFSRPWLVKLNSDGDTLWTSQWTNTLPPKSALMARGVLLPNGRIVVVAAGEDLGMVPKMFIVSQEGLLIDQPVLNAPVPPGWYSGTVALHIESTNDGGFVLTGTAGGGSSSKAFLWKFDHNADSSWVKVYNNFGMRAAGSVKQLSDGGYILVGFSSPNSEHSCALRTDEAGNVVWFNTYPDQIYTNATDVIQWNSGQFLITEKRFDAVGGTFFQSSLITLDSDGNLLSREMIMASDSSTTITRLRNTGDGGFVMAGEINEYLVVNEQDLFVLKSDAEGNISGLFIDYVWPGDVNYDGIVNMDDLMILGVTAGATGPVRVDQSIGWYPHYVTNWADTVVTGVNYKHADTDGNGVVDINDTLAIIANYGLTWGMESSSNIVSSKVKSAMSGNDLFIIPEEAVLIDALNVEVPLYLGEAATPVNGFYGMRFSLAIDPNLVLTESIMIDFTGSWLGTLNNDLWAIQKPFANEGLTDVGVTLNNHQSVSGFGFIGHVKFTLAEPIQNGEVLTLDIHFNNFLAHGYDLTSLDLSTGSLQIVLDNNLTGVGNSSAIEKINVFPNPVSAGESMFIQTFDDIKRVQIFHLNGVKIKELENTGVSISSIAAPSAKGVYILKTETNSGKVNVTRLIVQ